MASPRNVLGKGLFYGLPADVLELVFKTLLEMRDDPENWRSIRLTLNVVTRAVRTRQDWNGLWISGATNRLSFRYEGGIRGT